jgi:hypothetical protein
MTALGLVFAALAGATMVNALALQTERHPAPLFSLVEGRWTVAPLDGGARLPPPRDARAFSGATLSGGGASDPAHVRAVQTALQEKGFFTGAVDGRDGARTQAAIRDYVASLEAEPRNEAGEDDALRRLIESDGAAKPAAPADRAATARLQAALNALGYGPLAEDGVAGPATRAAIDAFARDRGLGADVGDAKRTRAILAAASAER